MPAQAAPEPPPSATPSKRMSNVSTAKVPTGIAEEPRTKLSVYLAEATDEPRAEEQHPDAAATAVENACTAPTPAVAELLDAAWAPSSNVRSVRLPEAVVTPAPPLTLLTLVGPSVYCVLEAADAPAK